MVTQTSGQERTRSASRSSDGKISCASGTATALRSELVKTQAGGTRRKIENLGAVLNKLSDCSTYPLVTSHGVLRERRGRESVRDIHVHYCSTHRTSLHMHIAHLQHFLNFLCSVWFHSLGAFKKSFSLTWQRSCSIMMTFDRLTARRREIQLRIRFPKCESQ